VAKAASDAAQAGYRLIKVKIGVDARLDIERLTAVRASIPPETLLSADANEGYSLGEALQVCAALEPLNLLCVEQPLVRWDLAGHARLRASTRVPLMLDESVMSPAQMLAAIEHRAADYVFLKLDNCGGLHPARQVATVARAGNVVPIAGGSAHTGIGATALAHLAVALDLSLPAGVNGPQQLAPDCLFVKQGGVQYERGGSAFRVPERPGLGVDLDRDAVEANLVEI
jgi:muconate cycloisomerase